MIKLFQVWIITLFNIFYFIYFLCVKSLFTKKSSIRLYTMHIAHQATYSVLGMDMFFIFFPSKTAHPLKQITVHLLFRHHYMKQMNDVMMNLSIQL